MGKFIRPEDLEPFAEIDRDKAEGMIADAESLAALAAPCLDDPEFVTHPNLMDAAKAILRAAIIRWDSSGSGAVTQVGSGPFQQTIDTRTVRRSMLWPSEIEQLRNLCAKFNNEARGGAFAVDTAPRRGFTHQPWCSLFFLGDSCSCQYDALDNTWIGDRSL